MLPALKCQELSTHGVRSRGVTFSFLKGTLHVCEELYTTLYQIYIYVDYIYIFDKNERTVMLHGLGARTKKNLFD